MNKKVYTELDSSILIAGLGISGLITACLFAKNGFSVKCFEPTSRNKKKKAVDRRTTAFLNPAVEIFKEIGVWMQLEKFAQPLNEMEIIDVSNNQLSQPVKTFFNSKDISLSEFGFNIPNKEVLNILLKYLENKNNVDCNFETKIVSHYGYDDFISVKTEKGSTYSGKLLIACDGKNSLIRKREKIKSFSTSYDQLGLVFEVNHELNHNNTTTEILDQGGPFTIIPLKRNSGCNYSTIVWMDYYKNIREIYDLDQNSFNKILQEKSYNERGAIKLNGERQVWPIITQVTNKLYGKRVALLAESAHVMPPTGAQGLNTSIEDIRVLVRLLVKARSENTDIGNNYLLKKYNKTRLNSIGLKTAGMHLLNKISMSSYPISQKLRKTALNTISKNFAIKSFLMNIGLNNKSL